MAECFYNLQQVPSATFLKNQPTPHLPPDLIPVNPKDIPKTAVTTPFRSSKFLSMSFRLRNAGSTFQCFIDEIIRGMDFVFAYGDDILVPSFINTT